MGIKNAKSILIIGAGSLGVELAGEFVEAYAGKTVTLVNAGARLFEGRPAKVGDACAKWLKEHGVEVGAGPPALKGPQADSSPMFEVLLVTSDPLLCVSAPLI